MQKEACSMMNWFINNANGMNANPSKFQSMLMGDASSLRIIIDNHEIVNTTEVKSLGIIIDYKLKFDMHLREICKSAARQLNALRRLSIYLDENSRLLIYKSFILANFNYCEKLLEKVGTSTLYLTRLRNIAIESFKIMHNLGPSYL